MSAPSDRQRGSGARRRHPSVSAPAADRDQSRQNPAGQNYGQNYGQTVYAALDLGTNNCRLMIASLHNSQFHIVEAFSRIVRLGEGLAHSGQLHDHAMDRAIKALRICAEKIERRGVARVRAVATQACRIAHNGQAFIARVERETGLKLTIISPEEEAHLSVMGCASLLDPREVSPVAKAALVMDVGGGSTELSWVELEDDKAAPLDGESQSTALHVQNQAQTSALRTSRRTPKPRHWISMPVGVVNLAERFPEPKDNADGDKTNAWFEAMVQAVMAEIHDFKAPEPLRPHFDAGAAYIVGTSGAITSLAGLHLRLERYDRSKVDGLWMRNGDVQRVIRQLLDMGHSGREREPCIGRDRADLVLAGAAILEAVQRLWPCERLRVADRGLREGLLLSMAHRKTRRRRRRKPAAAKQEKA
ncbi:Ppx/GppA phosphatase family protein [Asticcacaulis sp. EMRT-3]|uniref:Ppx/GppA phosphatase family protein n=1 Tax=Asticcacaulis sp. EMRT-3 TaxID=3040349 RepID=UPI0024AFDBE2|nr:Ppx/GppA phosphatase family protein [Asticcacaulis sp. EMRT-3]MDI7774666.1 Ppx/GppA phosphatase family protein [Asticcacaulis sp. EMRT-3]